MFNFSFYKHFGLGWVAMLIFFSIPRLAEGQWLDKNMFNTIASNNSKNEYLSLAVSDNFGGSIIFFVMGPELDLYAQKISASGNLKWGRENSPIKIANAPNFMDDFAATGDGAGGAYISWSDYSGSATNGKLFLQHINADGLLHWPGKGLQLTDDPGMDDFQPILNSDDEGGVFIVWSQSDWSGNVQLKAQRVDASGNIIWGTGRNLSTASGSRGQANVVADGVNGIIVFFADTRNDFFDQGDGIEMSQSSMNTDVYAQRINGDGERLWGENGVAVCTAEGNQALYAFGQFAVPDGEGGAIFAFDDNRELVSDSNGERINEVIYVQRINSYGQLVWPENGIKVTSAHANSYLNTVASDQLGGIMIGWTDPLLNKVYLQRVTASGDLHFGEAGLEISLNGQYSAGVQIINSGTEWYFVYEVFAPQKSTRIQKIHPESGKFKTVTPIVLRNNETPHSFAIASGNGNLIVLWEDRRYNETGFDLFAAKVLSNFTLASTGQNFYRTKANGFWNNPNIWENAEKPHIHAKVLVNHQITLSGYVSFDSLVVKGSNAVILIEPGTIVQVNAKPDVDPEIFPENSVRPKSRRKINRNPNQPIGKMRD